MKKMRMTEIEKRFKKIEERLKLLEVITEVKSVRVKLN